jgi:hypothetical protein
LEMRRSARHFSEGSGFRPNGLSVALPRREFGGGWTHHIAGRSRTSPAPIGVSQPPRERATMGRRGSLAPVRSLQTIVRVRRARGGRRRSRR